MADKTTLLVTGTPNPGEQDAIQAYSKAVLPLLMAAGGEIVKRLKVQGAVTGKPPHGMALVMDFPDRETIEAVFASEAYAAIVPLRDKGFSSIAICLTSEM